MCEHERGETGIESKRCVVGNARNAAAYRTRRGVVATGRAGRVRTRGRRPRRGRVGSRLLAPAGTASRVRPEHCRVMSRLITYGSSKSRFGHLAAGAADRHAGRGGLADTTDRTRKGNRIRVRVADSLHVRSTCWPPAQSVLSALRSRHRCWAYCSWVPPPGPCLLLQSSSSLPTDSILKLHPSSATSSCSSSSSSSSSSVHHPKACASGREARPQTGASILQEFFRQSPHHRRQDPKEW